MIYMREWFGGMVGLKRYFSLLLLVCLLVSPALSASEVLITSDQVTGYRIDSYHFVISGNSKEFALRNAIIPSGGDPVFENEQALVNALDAKKQILMNKRIFTDVEYTYTMDSFAKGIVSYAVTYYIEDANTLLAIPYAKFDNDEIGLRFGVKLYEDNLLGTFGSLRMTGHISEGNGGLTNWQNREDYLELVVSGLEFWGTNLDLNLNYFMVKNSPSEGDLDYKINWSGLSLFKTNLGISTWADFNPASDFSALNPTEYGLSWSFGPFNQSGGRYSINNTIELNSNLTNIYTYTVVNQYDVRFFSKPLSFNVAVETNKAKDAKELSNMTISATLGTSFRLPFGFSWSTSVAPVLEYSATVLPVPYSYKYTNTLSKSNINWVGNFRKGMSFYLNHVYQYYPQPEYTDTKTYWYLENRISWFPFIFWHLNPSIQFNGFYAEHINRYFLPSENKDISEYFRGFLSRSLSGVPENGDLPWGAIINMNLTADFINFGFAKSYVNPFVDIGFFADSSQENGMSVLATAGVEGWGILNKFPSYPVRGSLGFNLADVKKAIDGEMDFKNVEWELSIGMGLFF